MSASRPRPKAAVFHPWLIEGGGSEAVALWSAQALSDDFDVDILTTGSTGLDALNAAYGTSLRDGAVRLIRARVPGLLLRRGDALRAALASRAVRPRLPGYDLLFSSYNGMDFGRRGMQYISDFSFDDSLRAALLRDPARWAEFRRRPPLGRRLYLGAAGLLARQTASGWRRNLTLANSQWTRRMLAEAFGVESEVVYPPVTGPEPEGPWDGRRDGFVTVGRIVPEKRVDELAEIVAEVGRAGLDVHLHVLGRLPDDDYGRRLARMAASSPERLRLEGAAFGEAKHAFLRGHKYGLSGCRHEAFGLSAAEMVRAGLIVWVPRGGGQVEIVDHPELVFDSPADAAAKIVRVLRDPSRQTALREHLKRQAAKFSSAAFGRGIRRAAEAFRGGRDGR